MKTDVYALQRSDLNAFLFADVGVEVSGMTLSVLSMLARLGVDPWREAAHLAELPRTAAADGLARTIAATPASPWSLSDAAIIAGRLMPLLPMRGGSSTVSTMLPASPGSGGSRTAWQWVVTVILIGVALAGLAFNLAG